jgi:hypothetical protein
LSRDGFILPDALSASAVVVAAVVVVVPVGRVDLGVIVMSASRGGNRVGMASPTVLPVVVDVVEVANENETVEVVGVVVVVVVVVNVSVVSASVVSATVVVAVVVVNIVDGVVAGDDAVADDCFPSPMITGELALKTGIVLVSSDVSLAPTTIDVRVSVDLPLSTWIDVCASVRLESIL